MRLVNEISLKRLPHITELNLAFSNTTLNASFIPSCLKFLSIRNLISQKDLVGTNIISLKIYESQTPLEFIPTNLRTLWLEHTDLKVTCENLRQSKIENLYIHVSSFPVTDVSNNATESLLTLQYYNQLHKNCTIAEIPAETVTSRAKGTTGNHVVLTLPSASTRLTSNVSASPRLTSNVSASP